MTIQENGVYSPSIITHCFHRQCLQQGQQICSVCSFQYCMPCILDAKENTPSYADFLWRTQIYTCIYCFAEQK